MFTSAPTELLETPPVFADLCRFQLVFDARVSSHLFCPHLAQLRVHKIILHPCSNPGSTFLRVKLSDHQATPAAQRSKFRHHHLRDVNASAVLVVPGSRRCWFGLNLRVHHRKMSGKCSRVWIDFHASVLQTPRISECSQQHFKVPAFFFASSPNAATRHHRCTVTHDVFFPSRVGPEPATVHPVHSEFLLLSGSLVWSLIARICPGMVWFARSMLLLALLSPTGLSSYTISVGMCVPALCLTSMMLGS